MTAELRSIYSGPIRRALELLQAKVARIEDAGGVPGPEGPAGPPGPQGPAGPGLTDGDKGDITIGGGGTTMTIDPAAVTLAKMADLPNNTAIGRVSAGTGVPETFTVTSAARNLLDDASNTAMRTTLSAAFNGIQLTTTAPLTGGGDLQANRTFGVSDFTSTTRGTVPASGGGTANYLRADGTWAAPAGGGGGGVASVVAGANVTVNATDPANPVVATESRLVAVGTLITPAPVIPANTVGNVTNPITFVTKTGHIYAITLRIRAVHLASVGGNFRTQLSTNSGVNQGDAYFYAMPDRYTHVFWEWLFTGDGASHTFIGMMIGDAIVYTATESDGAFYVRDLGKVLGP